MEEMRLSVVVPARDEERVLGECLRSLAAQSERGFELGREWELIVVDDGSTDGTRGIAEEVARGREGVRVLEAPAVDTSERGGFTGKNGACWTGAQAAGGAWLLFTDADTVHEPGNLSRALHEAAKYKAGLLSYSPRQVVTGLVVNEKVNLPREVRRKLRAVEHHLKVGKKATLTEAQVAGWRALVGMVERQRAEGG